MTFHGEAWGWGTFLQIHSKLGHLSPPPRLRSLLSCVSSMVSSQTSLLFPILTFTPFYVQHHDQHKPQERLSSAQRHSVDARIKSKVLAKPFQARCSLASLLTPRHSDVVSSDLMLTPLGPRCPLCSQNTLCSSLRHTNLRSLHWLFPLSGIILPSMSGRLSPLLHVSLLKRHFRTGPPSALFKTLTQPVL